MKAKRIVSNIETPDPTEARRFVRHGLGRSGVHVTVQGNFALGGCSGTPVAELSIEAEHLGTALERGNQARIPMVHGPVSGSSGVRRFYVRDPFGKPAHIPHHAE